jgi:glycosyltransferase involved in cell wall biosynthesis
MTYGLYRVSVVIPTLNEAKNLPLVFPRIPTDIVDEVILVDGQSTDGTVEVARAILPTVKVVLAPRRGKGAAMYAGYKAVTGDVVIVLDADGSNDPREIPRYLRALVEGADFVKGSRFAHHGGTTDMPRYRQIGNSGFVMLVNLLFGSKFTDLCYGYHAFWRYCLDAIDFSNIDGFEIDTALYLRAVSERLRIVEVPSFEGYRFYGVGKLETVPDGLRVLRTILSEWTASLLHSRQRKDHMGFRVQELPATVAGNLAIAGLPQMVSRQLAAVPSGRVAALPSSDPARMDLQLLLSLTHALALEINLREMLHRVLKLTLDRMGATSGSVLVLNERGEVLDGCIAYEGALGPLPLHGRNELVEQGLAGWVVRNRQPVLVTDTWEDPRWLRRSWEESASSSRSAIGAPLMAAERVIGVLTLVRRQPEPFTAADLDLMSALTVAA